MDEAVSPRSPDAAAASLRSAASVFSLSAAAALLASFFLSPESLPGFEVCSFKSLTGLPCPGCGLTRGFCAISHGRLAEATAFNAFSIPLYGLALLLLASPWLVRRFPGLAGRAAQQRLFRAGGVLAVAMAAYGIWRMVSLT